ncbi:hypothetical protein V6N00_12515 [Tersicoccus sp. MR15.9]|uniref:hypothetical protein n=1 Tax=Tersicoccus mangrovi TaxID=3121635 RepID=UPI002FE5EB34
MSTATTTRPAVAQYGVDQFREQPTQLVASELGRRMADARHGGTEIASTLELMDELGMRDAAPPQQQVVTRVEICALALARARADRVYDSEAAQATQAFTEVLTETFGPTISVRGWIPGERISVNGERFELTGRPCEKCETCPEAFGVGAGIRCVDQAGCGHSFCY